MAKQHQQLSKRAHQLSMCPPPPNPREMAAEEVGADDDDERSLTASARTINLGGGHNPLASRVRERSTNPTRSTRGV
eukprot:4710411-Alexandrium_andersonii.AAC.1